MTRMTPAEIQSYLHRQIPISAAMEIRVAACDASGVALTAPLAPNVNHRATVFGGSASSAAILAAWTWLHFSLREAGEHARLVIQRNTMDYLAPITRGFEARCDAPAGDAMKRFLRMFRRHGKARITLDAILVCDTATVARFSGEYVALR